MKYTRVCYNETMDYNTIDELMEDTEVYCKWHSQYYEQIGMKVEGWWMSKLALDDVMEFECLN